MTVTAIESARQVLTQWISVKEQNIEKLIDANNLLLGGISNLHEKQFNQFNSDCNDLFRQYEAAKEVARLKNRNTSAEFNVLRLFEINEPKHSSLLAGLLHPQGHHGQGDLFLHLFLEQLGIEKPKEGHWAVTAEKGRIDILLKRTYPRTLHSAIIIENKSNNARETRYYRITSLINYRNSLL